MLFLKGGNGSCRLEKHGGGFSLGVTSHRNNSGFWITKVDVASQEKFGQLSQRRRMTNLEFKVAQDVALCYGSEMVKISTEVTTRGMEPPAGYEMINGLGFYKLHTSPASWETARATCEQEGGHLIVVHTHGEAVVVQEMLARFSATPKSEADRYCLVGIHIRYSDKIFRSIFGEPLTSCCYNTWAPGQPKALNNTLCGVMDRFGRYHDVDCTSWKYVFICEFP
ncbi:hemolymph lipopolysaccharide-binding protein [Anabrus simplex]|uniref:hemolymph lipopolysaccharide-binding protein n=1 Tax=Anabrus simplex TaxID=316456 RepID=UPI0035A3B450